MILRVFKNFITQLYVSFIFINYLRLQKAELQPFIPAALAMHARFACDAIFARGRIINENEVCERVLPPSMGDANLKKAREKGARGKVLRTHFASLDQFSSGA